MQLDRVRNCPQAGMIGEKVYEKLETSLKRAAETITGSTVTQWVAERSAAENPFAAAHPEFLTNEEKNRAQDEITQQLESGTMTLPGPLSDCLAQKLEDVTDGFLEMLGRMEENREVICTALTGGKLYQRIEDAQLSAGDTHNRGRSVMVLVTDVGKLVYKPHDMRGDEWICTLAERFFPEFVGVPRSVAFGEHFGVCEFIDKRRAEGEEEAERFFYALGGLTGFVKLLGSTDLHFNNILCSGTKPYIIDLETVISPISAMQEDYVRSMDSKDYLLRSPGNSLLMPSRIEDMEISVLMNVEEGGIAPIVDGKRVTVRRYLHAYKEGYRAAYNRAVEQRVQIAEFVRSFPQFCVRIVLRATRGYCEVLKKLYHHTAMTSEEGREQSRKTLEKILSDADKTLDPTVIDSEVRQMMRGDVPYFYTYTDSLSLYGDGEELTTDKFGTSAVDHILDTLYAMGKQDELFDLTYIDRAIEQYPEKLDDWKNEYQLTPEGERVILSAASAADEVRRILKEMYELRIPTPNGKPVWGYVGYESQGLSIGDAGLFYGFTGLAVFACACAAVLGDEQSRAIANELIGETIDEIHALCRFLGKKEYLRHGVPPGEGAGFGGILTGLALMRRYTPDERLDVLVGEIMEILEQADFSICKEPDRINGLAGLISVLCRFEEYREYKTIIRRAADRLIELKEFSYRDAVVWKTMRDIPRAISGAGHGMAGIAEALFTASFVLGDERYIPAAEDALDYERRANLRYAGKFGTWADLREFPPKKYMHGYCAGAPGIGIMLSRIMDKGYDQEAVKNLAGIVRKSVDNIPLNISDHLCCGNSAVVEYYLSVGDVEAAGRVLGYMYERRQREGSYRYSSYKVNNSVTASLFNGLCGIGYEMLRFAFPERVLSIL